MPTKKEIEEKVEKYRQRLETMPPKARPDPAVARAAKLERAETVTEGNDRRRIQLLLSQAKVYAAAEQLEIVYAMALEIAHLCRLRAVGYTTAYPVLAAPARRLSELPVATATLPGEDEQPP